MRLLNEDSLGITYQYALFRVGYLFSISRELMNKSCLQINLLIIGRELMTDDYVPFHTEGLMALM